MQLSVTVFVLNLWLQFSSPEIFSAVHQIEKLFENEETTIEEIGNLIKTLSETVEDLKRFELCFIIRSSFYELSIFRKQNLLVDIHNEIRTNQIQKFVSNPLVVFALIKRATFDIKLIEKQVHYKVASFMEKVEIFASDNDLVGAVEGILRLQTVYKLKSIDIAKGNIYDKKVAKDLSVEDLNLIASKAHDINEDYFAQEYWNLALKKTEDNEIIDDILLKLAESYGRSGDLKQAIPMIDKILERDPSKIAAFLLKEKLESLHAEDFSKFINPFDESFEKDGKFHLRKEEMLYRKACRGEMKKDRKELAILGCRYHSTNSFTKLARFKIEEVNLNPRIILFIEILSTNEINHLKNISIPKIDRAMIFDQELVVTKNRIAQASWHEDGNDKIVARISQRIADMTSLSMKSAESLQVQNYGIGGHYTLHYDHRLNWQAPFNLSIGNRIASVLFYVS